MDDVGLFDEIHSMTNEQLSVFYKGLLDLLDHSMGFDAVWKWIIVFMDGIQAECADRVCGTNYNNKDKELKNNIIQLVGKN